METTNADIRAWARANGHPVADRGRIPASVIAAHAAAQHDAPPPEGPVPDPLDTDTFEEEGFESDPPAPEVPRKPLVRSTGRPRAWGGPPPEELPADPPARWDPPSPEEGPPPVEAPPRWAAPAPQSAPPVWAAPPPQAAPPAWGAPPPGGAAPPAWGPPPAGPGWSPQGPMAPPPSSSSGDRDGFSIAALVLGIIPFTGLFGVIFGGIALLRIRKSGKKGKGMAITGIVLGLAWIALFALGIALNIAGEADRSSDGTVTSSGSVTVTGLRVGDCPSSPLTADKIVTLQLVPCSQPHRGEVYSVFPLSGTDYPGEAQAKRFAKGGCLDRLAGFVGQARQDDFDLYYVVPTARTWDAGHNEVQCLVTAPGGGMLPGGSAKAP